MKARFQAGFFLLTAVSAFGQEPPKEGAHPQPGKASGEERSMDRRGRDGKGRERMKEMWEKADTDGDGYISEAEFAAMERPAKLPEEKRKQIFERLDKNGDGRLGPDDMPRRGQGGMPPLEKVDFNKDGKIVFEEFQKLGFVARLPEERQRAMFSHMDSDKDGALTPKDRGRGGPPWDGRRDGKRGRGPSPLDLIKELDENGDGALGFEEFRKAPFLKDKDEDEQEDRFEEMDRNGDLKIDATDFPAPEHKKGPEGKPRDGKPE